MPKIASFQGLRYNTERFTSDISKLVAPPYDVLDAEDKAGLLRGCERNIVAVDLPHVPPKSAGPEQVYTQAAELLEQWKEDQTLVCEHEPAIYVYHQEYTHGSRLLVRRKFFARMRLEEFGKGTVFPHEQTFSGPKEDRLKLMQATRCQLSAVFGLYSDADNAVSSLLDVSGCSPDATAELDNVLNRLWVVKEPAVIKALCDLFADRAVYIADGHHRYGTALMYRDALSAQMGDLPSDHPAQFILVGLCAMEDPGAVILPTHRVLSGFGDIPPAKVLEALQPGLKTVAGDAQISSPEAILPAWSPNDLAVYVADGNKLYMGTFTKRSLLETLAPERSQAWRELDLAYLHGYLLDELIVKNLLHGETPTVQYLKSVDGALQVARENNGIAFICKPCTMDMLRGVSQAGDLMPQKSTFFYPKLVTGLVLNPLA